MMTGRRWLVIPVPLFCHPCHPIRFALTNKGVLTSNAIIIEENNKLISDEKELVEIFNNLCAANLKGSAGKTSIRSTMESGPKGRYGREHSRGLNATRKVEDTPRADEIHNAVKSPP